MSDTTDIDTTNKYFVGGMGDHLTVMIPPRGQITKADALNLAAYLVTLACDDDLWQRTLAAVKNS